MRIDYYLKKRKGFVLIIVVGVLCVLTLITMTFTVMSRLEEQTARNFKYSVNAKYLAEAGINRAIAGLKSKATSDFIWSVNDTGSDDTDWYDGYNDSSLLSGQGSYNANVIDCSSQIYINGDNTGDRLKDMLNILGGNIGGDCDGDEGTEIINNRPTAGYETKEQLRIALTEDEYNAIKDYVTVYTYVNSSFNQAPINVNTAKQAVLETVLEGISGISDGQATTVANAIMSESNKRPFSDWSDFDTCIDGTSLTSDEKQLIKDNCNPNSMAWNSTTEVYEHSCDTTEFCFYAGGYFEIESEGKYYDLASNEVARRTFQTMIKVFEVAYETDKEDFIQGDCVRVTYWDNCPVDSSDDCSSFNPISSSQGWGDLGSNDKPDYTTIPGSLKIGFWEDFDEGYPTFDARLYWDTREGVVFEIDNNSSDSPGNELYIYGTGGVVRAVDLGLSGEGTTDKWQWPDASFRSWTEQERDSTDPLDVAYILGKCQHFAGDDESDYVYGEKQESWSSHDISILMTGVPGCYQSDYIIDHACNPWVGEKCQTVAKRDWKILKLVVSKKIINLYDNRMDDALQSWNYPSGGVGPDRELKDDNDFATGSFGAYGMGEFGATYIKIDNIRIIPRSPDRNSTYAHYDSKIYCSGEAIEKDVFINANWTIPSSASSDSEKLYVQIKIGSGDWIPNKDSDDNDIPGEECTSSNLPVKITASSAGNGVQFRVNFQTLDSRNSTEGTLPYFSETPALEDVTLIYVPKTEVLYYSER